MMKVRHIFLVLALAAAALLAGGCTLAKVKDISITSVGVKYLVPTSLRSVDAVLLLGVNNPSIPFTVYNLEGLIHQEDKPLATLTSPGASVEGKSAQVYELPCTITLADGVSFLDVLAIAARRSLEGITADIDLPVTLNNGMGTTLHFKDVDLTQLSTQ
jgi:hypothetical protein